MSVTLQTHKQRGFTIVELLIVIVVIAILAAISIVAYNGIQGRARDSQREQDVKTIVKALELYYIDNGQYPPGSGSTSLNAAWSATVDSSWSNLSSILVPKYISKLPNEPNPSQNVDCRFDSSTRCYAYYANGSYCGVPAAQMYILVYWLEAQPQKQVTSGTCSTNPLSYSTSYYRMVK